MLIKTKHQTQEYRDGWERAFGGDTREEGKTPMSDIHDDGPLQGHKDGGNFIAKLMDIVPL